MAAWIPAAIAGGASLLGGLYGSSKSRDQAQSQMDFQERMSSTSYQRAVEDMRKAGLNPILAAKQGGASTPAGAMANIPDPITPAVTSAMQMQGLEADVNLKKANETLTETKNVLSEALIPGAKSVSLLTTQLFNLLDAITQLHGENSEQYKQHIQKLESAAETVGEKLGGYIADGVHGSQKIGREAKDAINQLQNWLEQKGEGVKSWFKNYGRKAKQRDTGD